MKTTLTALMLAVALFCSSFAARASKKAPASTAAEFQRALNLAAKNTTKPAHKIVDQLLTSGKSSVPRDRLLMSKARFLYQDGDMRGAIAVYEQVPTDSDFWIESLEERAWARLRLGEHGKALADLQSLKAPLFRPFLGPEPYFLTGLIHLRVCDYPAIFADIKAFKEEYRPRVIEIQNLAKTGSSEAATRVVNKLRGEPIAWKTVAADAIHMPRLFLRDAEFVRRLENLKNGQSADATPVFRRLKELAERDLKEMSDILQKMHILEAEVIQRIFIAEKPKTRPNRDVEVPKGEEYLVFEDTKEFWLDELGHFYGKTQGCPQKTASGGPTL